MNVDERYAYNTAIKNAIRASTDAITCDIEQTQSGYLDEAIRLLQHAKNIIRNKSLANYRG
jgi:hypothetical protein